MTRIDDELKSSARSLRQRAKAAEAEWRAANRIARLADKRSVDTKAGGRVERAVAKRQRRHRDRQLGKLGAASAVRVIKPEVVEP